MIERRRRTDDLADRLCREADAETGLLAWAMHLLVLAVVGAGVVWTMLGIRDLRAVSERTESEILEFRALAERAMRAPRRDAPRLAEQLQRRIAEQGWHENLRGVRPRVLQTPVGLRIRFAETVPSLEERKR